MSIKNKKILFSLFSLIVIILINYFSGNEPVEAPVLTQEMVSSSASIMTTSTTTVAGDKVIGLDQIENESNESEDSDLFMVTKVVDGDTIEVNLNGKLEKLRLIGVDTPETVDPRKQVQCYGREASDFTKATLLGRPVRLELDQSQDERDKYGRLLVYVWLGEELFNQKLIAEGYAHEYTYKLPYYYQAEFKQAQVQARERALGLWSAETCGGVTF